MCHERKKKPQKIMFMLSSIGTNRFNVRDIGCVQG